MRYRATNGIIGAILTEAEAREHFDKAQFVVGEFGDTFVTCALGEYGRLLSIAATTYTPIREDPSAQNVRPGAWSEAGWPMWYLEAAREILGAQPSVEWDEGEPSGETPQGQT